VACGVVGVDIPPSSAPSVGTARAKASVSQAAAATSTTRELSLQCWNLRTYPCMDCPALHLDFLHLQPASLGDQVLALKAILTSVVKPRLGGPFIPLAFPSTIRRE
jgi:hypothetical protein